ncbi:MAG TPA: sigma-54 dependent transcriptional regulator [Nitrospira sp.]
MEQSIVLLISADSSSKTLLQQVLSNLNVTLLLAPTLEEGLRLLERRRDVTCVVCDDTDGRIGTGLTLSRVRNQAPAIPMIVLAAEDSAKAAMEAMHQGASDYLAKPFTHADLRAAILRTHPTLSGLSATMDEHHSDFDSIISVSPQMRLVKHLAAEVASTDATVLITGESGTGKELFARAIHRASPRSRGPFVALNCAGIPEHLLESELFGYQRGAFTDAKQSKIGRFQMAAGGTLFLDEIGEMSSAAQAKLLRVLEDHSISPLGDTQSVTVDIRVVAATNEDLPAQIKAGKFRLDLYYRLNVYQLRIPPLRERPEDIEPIIASFLQSARRDHGHRVQGFSSAALTVLRKHTWPGNVRELLNLVEGLTITCKDTLIRPEHLLPSIGVTDAPAAITLDKTSEKSSLLAFGLSFQDMEKKLLVEALRQAGGNVSEASRLLKLTRNTLRYRMAKYHLC